MSSRLVMWFAGALWLQLVPGLPALSQTLPRVAAAAPEPSASNRPSTLAAVRQRGRLRCGASAALPGFGQIDAQGRWTGFDIDFCRAVATAVLGDPDKVDFVPLTTRERLSALRQGTIDVLSRDTTWTMGREVNNDLLFAGVDYYDGQGFIVRKSLGVSDAQALKSSNVCVQQDTTTELNLTDFFRQRGLKYEARAFSLADDAEAAFRRGECPAYTADASALFVLRATLPDPDSVAILPQIISKEPLGPAVRQGDDPWFLIVRWTLAAMIDAEELGVTQRNVDEMARSENPRIKRLLGADGNFGQALGLTPDWAYRVIKYVGNYNDMFQHNLGETSKLNIKRGMNDLWTRGGLLYAAPIQ